MSREHHKNLERGIKQPLQVREQRVRTERHGKPHTRRYWYQEQVMVSPGTPNAIRVTEKFDPDLVYPAGTVVSEAGDIVVVHKITEQRNKQITVRDPFNRNVAAGPTGTYGKKNVPPGVKPKPVPVA